MNTIWPRICHKHRWRGKGECPGCKGEAAARKSLELLRRQERTLRTGGGS